MARKLKKGTVSRRMRLKLPGWRDGTFDIRPGRADQRLYRQWRELVQLAYREGYHDVLDALQDGEITMAYASKLSAEGGLGAIRAHLEDLAEQAARRAVQGNFATWLREFLSDLPRRKHASPEHHRRIATYVQLFLAFLVEQHSLKRKEDVAPELWSRENLEAYVSHYVTTKHQAAKERLEKKWARMDPPPGDFERKDELRKDRGKKSVTANRHVNGVGAFSQWLMDKGRIDEDPAVGVRITTRKEAEHREDSHRSLSPFQLRGFLKWSREYDRLNPPAPGKRKADTLYWEMLVATGARTFTEGSRLRPADIKEEEAEEGATPVEIRASKGRAEPRSVYVVNSLAQRLLQRAREAGVRMRRPLFPFEEGPAREVWDGVMSLIAERDPTLFEELEGATPYCLRHTFAVCALKEGVNIHTLKRLMGHKNIATTAMYLKHIDAPYKQLAAMGRKLGLGGDD